MKILSPNQLYQFFETINQFKELEQEELNAMSNGDYGNATSKDDGFKNLLDINF